MDCPRCGKRSKVIDTRYHHGNAVYRRRECKCGYRFTTYEVEPKHIEQKWLQRKITPTGGWRDK